MRLSTVPVKFVRTIKRVTGCKTWHIENVFVASVLVAVVLLTNKPWLEVSTFGRAIPVEWLGAVAVYLTFGHASVSFRLQEAEERRQGREVECYRKAFWYFLGKEACWFCYFTLLGAWSALVGVFVFLLYPWWRKVWLEAKGRA